jgi:hypothetical protein
MMAILNKYEFCKLDLLIEFLYTQINMTQTYTTVITQEGKWFVARCIELGVASQGRNLAQAEKNLKEAVDLYLN